MELHLPRDTEAMLQQCAAVDGKTAEDFAAEAIEEKIASKADVMLPRDEWKEEFKSFLASFPKRNTTLDDSRESIYRGRGE